MVQLEALRAMYNLCRISRTRQEAAAVAGIIPRLTALAAPPPPSNAEGLWRLLYAPPVNNAGFVMSRLRYVTRSVVLAIMLQCRFIMSQGLSLIMSHC
jgi:hypothetical protein